MLWRLGSMVHTSPLPSRHPPRILGWKHARSCWERLDLGREKGRIWAGNNARLGQGMGRIQAGLGQDWDGIWAASTIHVPRPLWPQAAHSQPHPLSRCRHGPGIMLIPVSMGSFQGSNFTAHRTRALLTHTRPGGTKPPLPFAV